MKKMTRVKMAAAMVLVGGLVAGCEDSGGDDEVYPKYYDGNANGINDYVEAGTHQVSDNDPQRHDFVDADGNGTCDYAERAEPTWHGPGYRDVDGDGECDYWDEDSQRRNSGRRDIVHGSDFDEVENGEGPHH